MILVWDCWCRALNLKAHHKTSVVILRTAWVILHVVTCIAIIANTIRHW